MSIEESDVPSILASLLSPWRSNGNVNGNGPGARVKNGRASQPWTDAEDALLFTSAERA
jgi:hypothetical protein